MLYSNHKLHRMSVRCTQIMDIKSFFICILSIAITLGLYGSFVANIVVEAQETKGGGFRRVSSSSSFSSSGIKGAAGFSSFRQNFESLKQRQQQQQPQLLQQQQQERLEKQEVIQQIQQPIQPSTVQLSNIVSSTSAFQAPVVSTQQRIIEVQRENNEIQQQSQTDSEPAVYGSVNGVPGVDFPGYTSIPNTPFTCEGRPFDPGMYADESTGCQVYHLCYQGRRESFLCGIGTVFNQAIMNCDFWHAVDCSQSSQYYNLNSEFGKASAEGGSALTSSNFAKQQVSSQFSSNQIQQPSALIGKTNFVLQLDNILNRPKLASSSSFRRVETSSGAIAPQISSSGKTSIRKEEQFFKKSIPSPGRQIQLSQSESFDTIDQNFIEPNQQSSESSTQFKVVNKQQASTSKTFDNKRKSASSSGISGSANEILQSEEESSVWKPYFKSKSSSSPSPSPPSSSPILTPNQPSATSDMLTSEVTSSTVSLPDKQPTFSSSITSEAELPNEQSKVPIGSAPYEAVTATSKQDIGSSESIEPDVSPALAVTTPTPLETSTGATSSGSATTTEASSTSDENSPVETRTPKASTEGPTTVSGSGEDNDFGSRSSRSSGSGGGSGAQNKKFLRIVATNSSVEYENESSGRNRTRRDGS